MKKLRIGLAVLVSITMMSSAMAQGHEQKAAHWEYTGHGGPSHWAELDTAFSACKLGQAQSPVNIRSAKGAALPSLNFQYTPSPGEIVNNGHTIQVNLEGAGSLKLESGDYKLLQFHFHTPSEETINGKHYPLVGHFVHKSESGELAVVAVLFKRGKENAALKNVFEALPQAAAEKHALPENIDVSAVLPVKHAYYGYMGSLTTPPCSEGVHWHVLKQPVDISGRQLAAFKKLYKMNARPVQPLHGRTIGIGS
jgi:carbonic anhydrase